MIQELCSSEFSSLLCKICGFDSVIKSSNTTNAGAYHDTRSNLRKCELESASLLWRSFGENKFRLSLLKVTRIIVEIRWCQSRWPWRSYKKILIKDFIKNYFFAHNNKFDFREHLDGSWWHLLTWWGSEAAAKRKRFVWIVVAHSLSVEKENNR